MTARYTCIYMWIVCTLTSTSTAYSKNDWLGRNCSIYVDANSWCHLNLPRSYCDPDAGVCTCQFGHHKATDKLGNVFCQKYSPDSKCAFASNSAGDLACRSGMGPMARCHWTGFCECHSNETLRTHHVDDKGCVKLANGPQCGVCSRTKGLCVDIDEDGVADDCHCRGITKSSGETGIERLQKGCDRGEANIGDFCNLRGPVLCSLPNAACKVNPFTSRYTCSCNRGFVAIPARFRPGVTECVPEITHKDDHNCTRCLETSGKCFDNDGDGQMDGCRCPSKRSSTDPNNPVANCDFKHVNQISENLDLNYQLSPFAVETEDEEVPQVDWETPKSKVVRRTVELTCAPFGMHVCYHPHNHSMSDHVDLPHRLTSGIAAVYIKGHQHQSECIFKPVNSGTYCLYLSFEYLEKCGTKLSETEMMNLYTNTFVVKWEQNIRTGKDLVFIVSCSYSNVVDISTARGVSIIMASPLHNSLSDPKKLEEVKEDTECTYQSCWSLSTDIFIVVVIIFTILILLMVGFCLAWTTQRRRQLNARILPSQENRNYFNETAVVARDSSSNDHPACAGADLKTMEINASNIPDQIRNSCDLSENKLAYSSSMSTHSTDSSPELQRHSRSYLEIIRCESVDLGYSSSRDLVVKEVTVDERINTSAPTDSGLGTSTLEFVNKRFRSVEDISVSHILETPVAFIFDMEQLIANHKLKPSALAVSPESVNATIQYQSQC